MTFALGRAGRLIFKEVDLSPRSLARRSTGASLIATGLRLERDGRVLLDDISLTLAPGDCIGVVGPNGIGKSTLLRTLAGYETARSGSVELSPPDATVGYLAQDRERSVNETVHHYLRRKTGLLRAEHDLEAASAALAEGDLSAASEERYSSALDRYNRVDPDSFAERAARAMHELGAAPALAEAEVSTLSGGELARVGLAALMLSRFDLMLLDEPTNDLDFAGLARLEELVAGMAGGVMVVSHDRAFLGRTVNAVLELGPQPGDAAYFEGDWTSYLQEKATLARHRQESFDNYTQARKDLLGRAQRERLWATTGVTRERKSPRDKDKFARHFRTERTEQLAARARRTEKAIERLEEVEKPWEPWQLRYTLKLAPRPGAVVARLDQAVAQRGEFRLGPVDLVVHWGDRVVVTGPNGGGKTTLVDTILGRAELTSGRRTLGPSVVPGEIHQERFALLGAAGEACSPGAELLGGFVSVTGLPLADARSQLAKFGLGAGHVVRVLRDLSPGERTRAQLAVFQSVGVNFLVLDEPTNHLDLPAIEQLELALSAFEGTFLIVTHDRRLLEALRSSHRVEVRGGRVEVQST